MAAAAKRKATIVWGRSGTVGRVRFFGDDISDEEMARVCGGVAKLLGSAWVKLDSSAQPALTIRQPPPRWCGGAAEREYVDTETRRTRDALKAALRAAGYSVR